MKILSFLFLTVFALFQIDSIPKEEYHRVRPGYDYEGLKLYSEDKYAYIYWMHLGYYVKDTGSYVKNDEILILNSLSSEKDNKRKREKIKIDENYKHFIQDTLILRQEGLIIYSKGENKTKVNQRLLYRKE